MGCISLLFPQRDTASGAWRHLTFELRVAFEPPDSRGWLAGHGRAVDFDLLALHSRIFLDVDDQIAWWDCKANVCAFTHRIYCTQPSIHEKLAPLLSDERHVMDISDGNVKQTDAGKEKYKVIIK